MLGFFLALVVTEINAQSQNRWRPPCTHDASPTLSDSHSVFVARPFRVRPAPGAALAGRQGGRGGQAADVGPDSQGEEMTISSFEIYEFRLSHTYLHKGPSLIARNRRRQCDSGGDAETRDHEVNIRDAFC